MFNRAYVMSQSIRFPIKALIDLPVDQRAVQQRIVERRGKFPPPYQAILASPEVADLFERLSSRLWNGALPKVVLESVFLSVARAQQCPQQWQAHAPKALAAGLSAQALEDIGNGAIPGQTPALSAALALVDELQRTKRLGAENFEQAMLHFGAAGVAELCAFLGFATSISILLNVQVDDLHSAKLAS